MDMTALPPPIIGRYRNAASTQPGRYQAAGCAVKHGSRAWGPAPRSVAPQVSRGPMAGGFISVSHAGPVSTALPRQTTLQPAATADSPQRGAVLRRQRSAEAERASREFADGAEDTSNAEQERRDGTHDRGGNSYSEMHETGPGSRDGVSTEKSRTSGFRLRPPLADEWSRTQRAYPESLPAIRWELPTCCVLRCSSRTP